MVRKKHPRLMALSLVSALAVLLPCFAWAQSIPTKAQPADSKSSPDPLNRETPYGTVTGFLKAAGQGNYSMAVEYLQLPHAQPTARDIVTARELEAILNHSYFGSLDQISRDREGNLADGLLPDRDSIGIARGIGSLKIDLELVRVPGPQSEKIWQFSRETLSQSVDFYERMPFTTLQRNLPDWLTRNEFFSLTALELLLFFLAAPAAWFLAGLLIFVARWGMRHLLIRFKRADWQERRPAKGPLRLGLTAVFHLTLVTPVLPALYGQYYGRFVRVLVFIAIYWLISNITDETVAGIEARTPPEIRPSTHSLLSLGRKIWKVFVALVLLLIVLKSFGVNVNSMLAGLGIGGIALGLGAQKTMENLFGGMSVLSDGSIRVGDFCKIADQVGTVEDIGLRATRIRTNARTVVSIPNGAIATANLENYAARDKFLTNPILSLRYETSADQLCYILIRLRELLCAHPKVEPDTHRVRFIRMGTSSLDVEVFAYVLAPDYPAFLGIQEEILLRIMGLVEDAGSGFAFPSQTTYIGRDHGLNPEKKQSALAAVERWRQEKRITAPGASGGS
jgi:MscS family membrane protein